MDFVVKKVSPASGEESTVTPNKFGFRSLPRPEKNSRPSLCRRARRFSKSCPDLFRDGSETSQSSQETSNSSTELDTTFVVENLKFTVHSHILAASSDVFQVMLHSPEWSAEEVQIEDVKSLTFWLLLLVLYYGWEHVRPCLDLDDALELFRVIDKYNIRRLSPEVTKFLQRNLSPDRALEVLDYAELYGLTALKSCCWSVLERNTRAVINAPSFVTISWERLVDILDNSRLTVNEYELFQAVMRWCKAQLRLRENHNKTAMEVLGVAVYKIRFPLMTPAEFNMVLNTGILAWKEVADLATKFRKNPNFCHLPRRNDCYCRRYRFRCHLCTIPKKCSATALDGRGAFPLSELKPRPNLGYQGVNGPPESCECIKYLSCPSFPGANTVLRMDAPWPSPYLI